MALSDGWQRDLVEFSAQVRSLFAAAMVFLDCSIAFTKAIRSPKALSLARASHRSAFHLLAQRQRLLAADRALVGPTVPDGRCDAGLSRNFEWGLPWLIGKASEPGAFGALAFQLSTFRRDLRKRRQTSSSGIQVTS